MIRREFCPYCEEECDIQRIRRNVDVTVRGEVYTVPEIVFRCTSCMQEFTRSSDDCDPVAAAFALFKEKHGYSPAEG